MERRTLIVADPFYGYQVAVYRAGEYRNSFVKKLKPTHWAYLPPISEAIKEEG